MQGNILMFGNNVVKITDFGQSRSSDYPEPCLKTTTYDRDKGTCRWQAYEFVTLDDDADAKCTNESDIWAFGMVLYVSYSSRKTLCASLTSPLIKEVLSKELPYNNVRGPHLEYRILTAISKKTLPKAPLFKTTLDKLIWGICGLCWQFDPSVRPPAFKVISAINCFRHVRLKVGCRRIQPTVQRPRQWQSRAY